MNEVQQMIDAIPVRHNLVSTIMLVGIVQGLFITLVLALRSKPAQQAMRLFGLFILCISLISIDVYLCYTGLMKYVLHLNDTTEPLVLTLGPLTYLSLVSLIERKSITFKNSQKHFYLPFVYSLSQIGYYIHPLGVKLNAYMGAYFPDWEQVVVKVYANYYYHHVKDHFKLILLLSFVFYIIKSSKILFRKENPTGKSNFWKLTTDKFGFARNVVVSFVLISIVVITIFLSYNNDLGDHIIIMFASLTMFVYSFFIMAESRIFDNIWIMDKYETSGFRSDHRDVLIKVTSFVEAENYYLNKEATLKDLADKLNISANYISQAINAEKGQNFNDFINHYRVEETKKRLLDEEYANLSIVGIGDTVGFKSKSAFYNAFKKQTEMTPTSFVKQQKSHKTA